MINNKSAISNNIPYSIKQGALLVATVPKPKTKDDYNPYYMIDYYYNNLIAYVNCYNILESSKEDYFKTHDINVLTKECKRNEDVQVRKFHRTTSLSKNLVPAKNEIKIEKHQFIQKPVFTSLIVDGTSTISGLYTDQGFYERDSTGKSTGVFIALNDIFWYPRLHDSHTVLNYMQDVAIENIKSATGIDLNVNFIFQ